MGRRQGKGGENRGKVEKGREGKKIRGPGGLRAQNVSADDLWENEHYLRQKTEGADPLMRNKQRK